MTYAGILLELLHTIFLVDAGEADLELFKGSSQNVEEVSELGEYNRLGTRIILSDPDDMTSQSVDFGAERSLDINVLDLIQCRGIDARV